MMNKKNTVASVLALVVGVSSSVPAMAAAVDLSSLTDAVDFSSAGTAVLAVGAALIVVYITIKAANFVIGMVKRG